MSAVPAIVTRPLRVLVVDDEELARSEHDVAVAELDRQLALDDEEEVVRVGMRVPDELALDLRELHLVVVDVRDDLRREDLVEPGEGLCEVDLVGHYAPFWVSS